MFDKKIPIVSILMAMVALLFVGAKLNFVYAQNTDNSSPQSVAFASPQSENKGNSFFNFFRKKTPENNNADAIIKIVARVNNDIITNQDVFIRQQLEFTERNIPSTPQNLADSYKQTLDNLVMERLQNQYADQIGVPNYLFEADQQLELLAQNNRIDKNQLISTFASRGVSQQMLLEYIASAIRWQSVLNSILNQVGYEATSFTIEQAVKAKMPSLSNKDYEKPKKAPRPYTAYDVLQFRLFNPNDQTVRRITTVLQQNPNWQRELAPLLNSKQLILEEKRQQSLTALGKEVADILRKQKVAPPKGTIIGPILSADKNSVLIYVLLDSQLVTPENLSKAERVENELTEKITGDVRLKSLQSLDQQMRQKLRRDAIVEFFS